jgi:glycosyltransferase involved in cell wall biosynthesis
MRLNQPPKYSILIPTKNGGKYLGYAIQSVLTQDYENFELVVSNNHSRDGTGELLSSITDRRLKVISPERPLQMAEHYEFMLSHARGEWVTIMGDDDALMPYFFDQSEKLTAKYINIKVISSARAYYFWQDNILTYKKLVVSYKSSPSERIRNPKTDLLLALIGLKSCFNLPQLYTTSIIKRELILRIKDVQGGNFYHSIIPDMYSAVAIALNSENYLRVELPLFWVGTSDKSMGISTRIYVDGINNSTETKSRHQLNLTLPQELHAAGFGSMYLYECLLQYPSEKNYFVKKIVIALVMSSILHQINEKKYNTKISHEALLIIFSNYLRGHSLNIIVITLISKILGFSKLFISGINSVKLSVLFVLAKLRFKGYDYFRSKNRIGLENISLASNAIKKKPIV